MNYDSYQIITKNDKRYLVDRDHRYKIYIDETTEDKTHKHRYIPIEINKNKLYIQFTADPVYYMYSRIAAEYMISYVIYANEKAIYAYNFSVMANKDPIGTKDFYKKITYVMNEFLKEKGKPYVNTKCNTACNRQFF